MKAIPKIINLSLATILLLGSTAVMAQREYDDMYFTSKDRKQVKLASKVDAQPQEASSEEGFKSGMETEPVYTNDSYSARNVNPDYIAQYRNSNRENAVVEENNNDSYSSEDYYVEDYRLNEDGERDIIINNNYYGNRYSNFNNPWNRNWAGRSSIWNDPFFFDPFYDPFFNDPWMASNWRFRNRSFWNVGWNTWSGWNMSFGWGWNNFGWNNWGWNRWNDPWFAWNRWQYDPWGYRPYNSFYSGYYRGFYNGFHNGVHVGDGNLAISPRRVVRGRYDGRSVSDGTVLINDQNPRRVIRTNDSNVGNNSGARVRTDRDYSTVQNEYYRRSRTRSTGTTESIDRRATDMNRSSSGARVGNTDTRSRSTVNTDSRSRTSTYNREDVRRTTPTYDNSRTRTSTPNYNNTRTNSSNDRYTAPSRERNYTPRRSYDNNNSYTPSRSTTTPSRSYSTPRNDYPSSSPSYSGGSRRSSSGSSYSAPSTGGSRSSGSSYSGGGSRSSSSSRRGN